jgi:hypothetical protein
MRGVFGQAQDQYSTGGCALNDVTDVAVPTDQADESLRAAADSPSVANHVSSRRVWLTTFRPFELMAGMVLPLGTYSGRARRTERADMQAKVMYTLEFSSSGMQKMGGHALPAGVVVKEFDVTDFVTFGQLIVS